MDYFIIGERELVLAFALIGVKGAAVVNQKEALEAFSRATGTPCGSQSSLQNIVFPGMQLPKILIITEDVSVWLEDELQSWQMSGKYPLVVEIPGLHGHISGKKTLTDAIREAVGIHI